MLAIFQIKISDGHCSYFVKRSFGNYLLFADGLEHLDQSMHDLFQSYGGISKLILESTQAINELHGSLFEKYGTSAVCSLEKSYFDDLIKVERLKDFVDPSITFYFQSGKNVIFLKQKGKNVLFVGKEITLKSDNTVEHNSKDISDYIYSYKSKYEIDLIYFSRFENESVLVFHKDNFLKKILRKVFDRFNLTSVSNVKPH